MTREAQAVLQEVAAQVGRIGEVVDGLCIHSEMKSTRHGRIGPADSSGQNEVRMAEMDPAEFELDILPLLVGDGYSRTELAAPSPEALLVDVERSGSGGSDGSPAGGVLLFTRDPARLVKASIHPPPAKRLLRLLLDRIETEVFYGYVRGVPLPVKSTMRFRTRGVGRLRIDQESVMTARYEECADA